MHCRLLVRRRDAHEPGHGQAVFLAAGRDKGVCLGGQDARLLRLLPGVDLYEAGRPPLAARHFPGQRVGESGPVDRFDHVEQRHRITDRIGLQRPDKMPLKPRKLIAQCEPFGRRFLHPVFAEDAVTSGERRARAFLPVRFADGDQSDRVRGPPRRGLGAADTRLDDRQVGGDVDRFARLSKAIVHGPGP